MTATDVSEKASSAFRAVVVEDGKVNGKPIIRAWESFSGWYWLATEDTGDGTYFGFVIGSCPEWGYFSADELKRLSPKVWELPPRAIKWFSKTVDW